MFAVVCLFVLVPPATSADEAGSSSPDLAMFHYKGGNWMDGQAEGTCSAAAVQLDPTAPILAFSSRGGVLETFETEWRTLAVEPQHENSLVVPLTARQTGSSEHVPAGQGKFYGSGAKPPIIFGADWPAVTTGREASGFQVSFATPTWESGPSANALETRDIAVAQDDAVWVHQATVPGWARWVRFGDVIHVEGDLTLLLGQGELVIGEGFHRHLAADRDGSVTHENDAAGYYEVRERHAFLRLTDATLVLPGMSTRVACRGLEADVAGTLTAFDARGVVDYAGHRVEFDRRELVLAGGFRILESTGGRGDSDEISVQARGGLEFVGLDFHAAIPSQAPHWLGHAVAWSIAATLLTVMVNGLKGAGAFFTRLERPALLELETRKTLVDALRMGNWMTMREIQASTGMRRSTLRYHLDVLERHRLVRSARVAGGVRFTARDKSPPPADALEPVLRRALEPGPLRLAEVMRSVARRRHLSRFGAWKAVRRAADAGTVSLERRGREVWVRWSGF